MTLHYIYDPLCGWCYAAAPLLAALRRHLPELPIKLHGGGLFAGQRLSHAMTTHIREHDARIGQLSGQPFGENYLDGLLNDPATRLDSSPPIVAILAATELSPALAGGMLEAVQRAHYQLGLRVSEPAVLAQLARDLGLSGPAFDDAFAAQSDGGVRRHLAETRDLMRKVGVNGFPGFVLEQEGQMQHLEHSRYYGRPGEFVTRLQAEFGATA